MLLTLAAILAAQPAPAEPAAAAPAAGQPNASDHDAPQNNDIVVTGIRRNREDVLGGISVLSSEELARQVRPTIGETLQRQPGVAASGFGPNASRPIIRGLSGDRIRILTDGIGSFDVSSSSPDHAVAINPLTADRIEVLRGPAALLFGSSASGGVVNVIDSRIPRAVPESPLHIDLIGSYGSASNERSTNGRVDVPLTSHLVLHGDGSWVKSDDLEIGGYVLAKPLRDAAAASSDPEIRALADLKGRLPNSSAESSEIAGGLAWVDGPLNVGVSISRLDNNYGTPIRYSLDPAIEAEAVRLDVKQTRYDARAEIPVGSGFIDQVRIRAGGAKYRHFEKAADTGEINSTFRSKAQEGRIEIVQRTQDGWGGGFGVQALNRRVSIDGDEKFLPPNRQRQFGLFALQNYETGPLRVEVGGRIEKSRLEAAADETIGNAAITRRFTSLSGSVGGSYNLGGNLRAGLNLSYTERAPSADELFANGPHGGTQAFEIGNPLFGKEKSTSIEGSLRRTSGPLTVTASVYRTHFDNYIYQALTGAVEDDLPVYQYSQAPANFTGFELETNAKLGSIGGIDWAVDGTADVVRATVKGFGPAPQIPPLRLLGGVEGRKGNVDGRLEVEHGFARNRNAPIETPTDGFTLVNASLNWKPFASRPQLNLGLQANNIFDVTVRRHTSLLKDYAPGAGRDIRLTARLGF